MIHMGLRGDGLGEGDMIYFAALGDRDQMADGLDQVLPGDFHFLNGLPFLGACMGVGPNDAYEF